MSQITYYTEEGLKKLRDELHEMKTVLRPSISDQIAEARDKGDLSENAEYDAAKEAQGLLEMKISKMEGILANARIIDESTIDTSKVFILSKVRKTKVTGKQILLRDYSGCLKSGLVPILDRLLFSGFQTPKNV